MPHATRAGDVLADRYRLVDLLSESGGGRFWRAHDRILERHVALHVIAADDPRAELTRRGPPLGDGPRPAHPPGARRRADRRLLLRRQQVDPAPRSTSCWRATARCPRGGGRGWSARSPTRSRPRTRTVSPTACSRPRTCCSTKRGSVRIIGFCVDAALHGMPPGDPQHDVVDLAGLLHATLTGRWAGVSPSGVPRAPEKHGPSPAPAGAGRHTPRPRRPLRRPPQPTRGEGPRRPRTGQCPRHPELPRRVRRRPDGARAGYRGRQPGEERDRRAPRRTRNPRPATPGRLGPPAEPEADPDREPDPEPDAIVEMPTQAGLPIFDDENDDVSWLRARDEPAPPPPPFEEPPERPLFPTRAASLVTHARTPDRWWRAVTSTGPSTT